MHHGPRDKQRLGLENYNDVGANVATITSMDKNKLKKKKSQALRFQLLEQKKAASFYIHTQQTDCLCKNKQET